MPERWTQKWTDFINSMAVGNNSRSRQARMIQAGKGLTPDASRRKIAAELTTGRIDKKTYAWRIECIDYMQQLYEQGVMGGSVPIDASWSTLPNGGHMRKEFKDGSQG